MFVVYQTAQKVVRVQYGAWNLSGKNKISVVCEVELKEPTCRHAAFREQVIQFLPFIQRE